MAEKQFLFDHSPLFYFAKTFYLKSQRGMSIIIELMMFGNYNQKKVNLNDLTYKVIKTVENRFEIMDMQLDQGTFQTINVSWDMDLKEVLLAKVISKVAIMEEIRQSAYRDRAREIHSNALKNEVMLQGKLKHENLLKMEQHAEDNQFLYLFFEYCPRGHLQAILQKQGRLPYEQAMPLWRQLLKVTAYLHRSQVVHRDIRPRNIYINQQGKLKLTNFKSAYNFDDLMSMQQTLLERTLFTAPEAYAGTKISSKMDVWSLGVMLFYMLFGCSPWPGIRENDWHRRLPSGIVYPDDVEVSERIKLLIGKMLIYDPILRISTEDLVSIVGI